ncbi:MAG: hypothetical protein IPM54_24330 [Polyangiaceae bacterium]|nr:hypothetical protein [Polyangiaceae bacterium]
MYHRRDQDRGNAKQVHVRSLLVVPAVLALANEAQADAMAADKAAADALFTEARTLP